MCAQRFLSGNTNAIGDSSELTRYREVLQALRDRIQEAWDLFELAIAEGMHLHVAVDFSEVFNYFIFPQTNAGEDSGKLMRLMISLSHLFEGETVFGSERRPLVLLPPYMAEMRDFVARLVANNDWDLLSYLLRPDVPLVEKTFMKRLEGFVPSNGEVRQLSPPVVARIVKDRDLLPKLLRHILERLYLAKQIRYGLRRFDALHEQKRILYFHEYRDAYWEEADVSKITEDVLGESSGRFFTLIDEARRHKRQHQSRRDAHACLYVERMNQVLPKTEAVILISSSKDLLESVGLLLRIPIEKTNDVPGLKPRLARRTRRKGTGRNAESEDQSDTLSLPALVPTETVFAFLMCAIYDDDRIDIQQTRETFRRVYTLASEFCKNLDIVNEPPRGKQKHSTDEIAQARDVLSKIHCETTALIRQYENLVSAVGAVPMWSRYIERAKELLDTKPRLFAQTLVKAFESKDIRDFLLDETAETLDGLWLQQTLEKSFLELMRQAEHGIQQIQGFLKGHPLRLTDPELRRAFSRFCRSLLTASRGQARQEDTRKSFIGLWQAILKKADSPEASLVSGFLTLHLGRFKDARNYLEKARKSRKVRSVIDDLGYQIELFLAIAYRASSRISGRNKALGYLEKARRILDGLPEAQKQSASWQKEKAVVEFLTWQETGNARHFLDGIRLSIAGLGSADDDSEIHAYLLSNLSLSLCQAAEMTGDKYFLVEASNYLKKLEEAVTDETLWEADFLDNKAELLICRALLERSKEQSHARIAQALDCVGKADTKALPRGLFARRRKAIRKLHDAAIHSLWIGINDKGTRVYHKVPFEKNIAKIITEETEVAQFGSSEEAENAGYKPCEECTKFVLSDTEKVELRQIIQAA